MNQPTAQFYRVALDNDFPYHAYGAQQDNSTVRTATRGRGGITEKDWYDVGGGESGWIAPDLRDTNIVYAGSYGNLITRFDARTGMQRNINPWPDNPMGHPAVGSEIPLPVELPDRHFAARSDSDLRRRERHVQDPPTKARAGRRSRGDLTRNDKSRQGSSGGPDHQGQHQHRILLHDFHHQRIADHQGPDLGRLRRRPGQSDARRRQDVDQRHAAERHSAGMVADQRDRSFAARSRDGLRRRDHVQVRRFPAVHVQDHRLRQDVDEDRQRHSRRSFHARGPRRSQSQGPAFRRNGIRHLCFLRFAATTGSRSSSICPSCPSPISAFHKRDDELVVATQGRAFWIMDDLAAAVGSERRSAHRTMCSIFKPKNHLRAEGGGAAAAAIARRSPAGANPPSGAVIEYWLKDRPQGEADPRVPGRLRQDRQQIFEHAPSSAPAAAKTAIAEAGGRVQSLRGRRRAARAPRSRHEPIRLGPPLSRRHHVPRT